MLGTQVPEIGILSFRPPVWSGGKPCTDVEQGGALGLLGVGVEGPRDFCLALKDEQGFAE